MNRQISHKKAKVEGVDIFYREAGDKENPSILLLHGFPSSSVMFKNLMIALSDKFHLIAPDYPGFGFSDFPLLKNFDFSFENMSRCIDSFTEKIKLKSFTIYLHDYGCPIGLRICLRNPGKINSIIVQSGNAYEEGLGPQWDETRDYWENPTKEKKKKVSAFLSKEGTREQYFAGLPKKLHENVSPESWMLDWERMKRPRNIAMQFKLNCTYKSNIELFPAFQQYFRQHRPPALIIWGTHDPFFTVAEAQCYQRDLPEAGIHILDGAHMLLETNFEEVETVIRKFLTRK